MSDSNDAYQWQCRGANGGSVASCSLPHIEPHFMTLPTLGSSDNSIRDLVVEYINAASTGSQIHMAYYYISDSVVLNALKTAKNRNVDVNIVIDGDSSNDVLRSQQSEICQAGKNCIMTCSIGSCLLGVTDSINHNKFILFSKLNDGREKVILQSSLNLNSFKRFNDLVVLSEYSLLYDGYLSYWNSMKNEERPFSFMSILEKNIRSYHFPKIDRVDPVLDELNQISCVDGGQVHIAMAYFSNAVRAKAIATKLSGLSASGCSVKVLTAIHLLGDETKNILGPLLLKSTDHLHSKVMIIDAVYPSQGSSKKQVVITGSENWTGSALYENDETYLRIEDSSVYAQYLAYWNTIYSKVKDL